MLLILYFLRILFVDTDFVLTTYRYKDHASAIKYLQRAIQVL